MFFTFLNKDNPHCLDLSVFLYCKPHQVLFYYYNTYLEISLDTWKEFNRVLPELNANNSAGKEWLQLICDNIELGNDLANFEENEFLDIIGPYYYPPTNTRFNFIKSNRKQTETITFEDIATLEELHNLPEIDPKLLSYYKARRPKKTAKKDDLLKDITMCMQSLNNFEVLNKHYNFLNRFLEKHYSIVEQEEIMPCEPDIIPQKPQKNEQQSKPNNIILFRKRQKNTNDMDGRDFNHEMKIYFIRYKEYEKACDRYKKVLENWDEEGHRFLNRCWKDIDSFEEELQQIIQAQDIYNGIILKSYIHLDYQDTSTLNRFKYYLETGRAADLQECMNLFEEEKHWSEIKASQERIENTIYFMQDDQNIRTIDEHINMLMNKTQEKTSVSLDS